MCISVCIFDVTTNWDSCMYVCMYVQYIITMLYVYIQTSKYQGSYDPTTRDEIVSLYFRTVHVLEYAYTVVFLLLFHQNDTERGAEKGEEPLLLSLGVCNTLYYTLHQ